MQYIGRELHSATGAFTVANLRAHPSFLDLCMAPEGFLSDAMGQNPRATAEAYSLPSEAGGHKVILPEQEAVKTKFLDITMLAADMSVGNIPTDHPELADFLPKEISDGRMFDIVFCDG